MPFALPVGNVCQPYIKGSNGLRQHAIAQIDSRIQGKTAGTALPLFDLITHADVGPCTRNTNFWAADQVTKLTCISPSNSERAQFMAGVAVTARHLLYTKHGGVGIGFPTDGTTMRFVTDANAMVTRTQLKAKEIAPDIAVGLLSSNLPGTIVPCQVAPSDLMKYLDLITPVPIMSLDQEEKGLVFDIRDISTIVNNSRLNFKIPVDSQRLAFNEGAIAGDSGDPLFLWINDSPVLVSLLTGVDWGPFIPELASVINQGILDVDALGGVSTGLTVTPANLSMFSKGA